MARSHNEYRLEEQIVALVEEAKLDLQAVRVLHGLHILIGRALPVLGMASYKLPNTPAAEVLTADLRRLVLPGSTNDLDGLRKGLAGLQKARLFDELREDRATHRLVVRPSHKLASAAEKLLKRPFAILDLGEMRCCDCLPELLLYTRVAMHMRSNQPMFALPHLDQDPPWSTNASRRWHRAAQRLSLIYDHAYLFTTEVDALKGIRNRVTVKISHTKTQWSSGCVYDAHAKWPPVVVADGVRTKLTKEDLKRRARWSKVDRPY